MKAAVYYNNKKVLVEEKPKPKISEKELLVKVKACGICGSDVMEWYRIKKAPLVPISAYQFFETDKNRRRFLPY